jgi:hypothetical protein
MTSPYESWGQLVEDEEGAPFRVPCASEIRFEIALTASDRMAESGSLKAASVSFSKMPSDGLSIALLELSNIKNRRLTSLESSQGGEQLDIHKTDC